MSPLEMWLSPKVLVMRADTVPFPDPGGPIITARKILWRTISARNTEFLATVLPYPSHEKKNTLWMHSRYNLLSYNRAQQGVGASFAPSLSLDLDLYVPSETHMQEEEEDEEEEGPSSVAAGADEEPLP